MVLRVEALHERLAKLEEVVARLDELDDLSEAEFMSDYRNRWLAERGLELAAQALVDIGNHILSGHYGISAGTNEQVIRSLGESGVLTADLAERLKGLGGLRNVLAHGYLRIDPARVFAALQTSVPDFTDFQAEILSWLDRLHGSEND